jgi:hypothetical protein
MVVLLLVVAKLVYEVWSTDGKLLESLWFRFRSSSMTAVELQKLEPSGFLVVSEDLSSNANESSGIDVTVQADIPQVTYYGMVLPQSNINQAVRNRVDKWFMLFQKEASQASGNVSYVYKIKGDVTYFSRHLLSIRLDVRQSSPEKNQFLDNLVIGVISGETLLLRDIIKTDEASCMALETFVLEQLYYRGIASDMVSFNCYNQPFILDAVGITLFKLVPTADSTSNTVRLAFSEYPDFFLPDGPVGSIVFP